MNLPLSIRDSLCCLQSQITDLSGQLADLNARIPSLAWSPAELPALRGWWVPGAGGYTAGSPVPLLTSQAGPVNNLGASGTARPTYAVSGGVGAITLDGTNDGMLMSDLSVSNGAAALTYFALMKNDSIPSGTAVPTIFGISITAGPSGTRFLLGLRNLAGTSKPWSIYARDEDASSSVVIPSAVNADLNTHVIIGSMNRAPAGNVHSEIWLDGVNILTNDQAFTQPAWPATDASAGYVGNRDATPDQSIIGKVMNFGVTRSALSTTDRQKLEGYLAWYGGIEGQLPSGHPYRNAPPLS